MYDRLAKGKELGLQSGKAKWNARPVRVPKANGEAGLGMQERERVYGGANGGERREEKRREGKRREGKRREEKRREGKRIERERRELGNK